MPRYKKIRLENIEDLEKKFLRSVELMSNAYKYWKIWNGTYGADAKLNMKISQEAMKRFLDSLNIVEDDTEPATDIS